MGANQDAWADVMAQVNQMGPEGAERQQVIVLGSIARSLAVIADHLTEGKQSWPPTPAGSATQHTARGSSVPVDSEPSTKNIASTAELSEVQVDNAPADLAEQSPSKARHSLDEIATSDHAKSQSSTVVAAGAGAAAKPIRSTPKARRGLTPEDVHNVSFSQSPSGKRGYNEDEVDGFLDLVEKKLRDPTANSLTILDVHNVSFSQPPWGKRGYNVDEVDVFLDRVEEEMKRRAIERTT